MEGFLEKDDVKLVLCWSGFGSTTMDLDDLFDMLDAGCSGYVCIDELLAGAAKAQGSAKGIDLQQTLMRIAHVKNKL